MISVEFAGTNPLRPELRETVPDLAAGPVPSAFNGPEAPAAAIKSGS
jgi:hypothetical protein